MTQSLKDKLATEIKFDNDSRTLQTGDAGGVVNRFIREKHGDDAVENARAVIKTSHEAGGTAFQVAAGTIFDAFEANEDIDSLTTEVVTEMGTFTMAVNRPSEGFNKGNIKSTVGMSVKTDVDGEVIDPVWESLESRFEG